MPSHRGGRRDGRGSPSTGLHQLQPRLSGRGYKPYLINGTDTFTGQDIALLTRIDPDSGAIERTDQAGTSGGVSKAVSKNYFAKLTVDGRKIALIGLHFLARPLDESRRLEREAQADAIRSLGLQLRGQGHQLVIWGDFNDFDGASDSRDHIDSSPISNVLKMLREMSTASTEDDLVNAASFVPKASRFTSHFDQNGNNSVDPPNELTSIDHILLSKELAEKVDVVQIPHNFNPVEVTDHFPIVVRIKLTQTPTPQPTTGGIRITRLLPNPTGDETQNEQATVKNIGT